MPVGSGLVEELRAIRDGTGLYNASSFGQLKIEGPDAAAYLQRMVTNEVQKLPIGEGRYNALLDRKGMVLSLFYLLRTGETEFMAITPSRLTRKTVEILTKMKFIQRVTITDESEKRGLLWLIGPGTERAATQGRPYIIWKDDVLGLPIWNLSAPRAEIQRMVVELSAKVLKISDEAVRITRMEAGFPEYGVDIDETHILLEANCPFFYQRFKGCYPGQEVIERILAYGKGRTPRSLCRFTLQGEYPIEPKTEIIDPSGKKAGWVTSSDFNPLDQKTIFLAYLEQKHSDQLVILLPQGPVSLPTAS